MIEAYIATGDLESFKALHRPYKKQITFNHHLQLAIVAKKTDFIDYLLAQDFKYNIADTIRFSLWHHHFEMFQYIFDITGANNPIHLRRILLMCVANDWLPMVKYLQGKGVDLNLEDGAAIKTAISFDFLGMIEYLMSQGLKIPSNHYYYLRLSCKRKNDKVKALILSDIIKKRKNLDQSLKICAQEHYLKGTIRLIKLGANYKIAQKYGDKNIKDYCTNIFHAYLEGSVEKKKIEEKINKI